MFGLSYALLDCSQETSLDDFSSRILAPDPVVTGRHYSPHLTRHAAESVSCHPLNHFLNDRHMLWVLFP